MLPSPSLEHGTSQPSTTFLCEKRLHRECLLRENAGQEHLPGNSAEMGAAFGAERARLQLTPSSAGATTEDGH